MRVEIILLGCITYLLTHFRLLRTPGNTSFIKFFLMLKSLVSNFLKTFLICFPDLYLKNVFFEFVN